MASNAATMAPGEVQQDAAGIIHSSLVDLTQSMSLPPPPPLTEALNPGVMVTDSPNQAMATRNRQTGHTYAHTPPSQVGHQRPVRTIPRASPNEAGREMDTSRYPWGIPNFVPSSHWNASAMTERSMRPNMGDEASPSMIQFPVGNHAETQEERLATLQRRRDMLAAMIATEQEIEELSRLKAATQPAQSGSGERLPQGRMIPTQLFPTPNTKSGNQGNSGSTQKTVRSNRLRGRLNPPEGNPVIEDEVNSSHRQEKSATREKHGGIIITTSSRRKNSPSQVPRREERRQEHSQLTGRKSANHARGRSERGEDSKDKGRSSRRNPRRDERKKSISLSPVRRDDRRGATPAQHDERRSPDMESAFEKFLIRKNVLKENHNEDYGEDQGRIFTKWIRETPPLLNNFPNRLREYNGKTNARDHVSKFEHSMLATSSNKAHWCTFFASTMSDKAITWLNTLKKDSIDSWADFKKKFLTEFAAAGAMKKDESSLFELRQREKESLADYIKRFSKCLDEIAGMDEKSIIYCFIGSLQPGPLKTEFKVRVPSSKAEMMVVAERIAAAEGHGNEEDSGNRRNKSKRDRRDEASDDEGKEARKSKGRVDRANVVRSRDDRKESRSDNKGPKEEYFSELTHSRKHIMNVLMRENKLNAPAPLNPKSLDYRDQSKHCAYHNDVGHDTEECKQLKRAIQRLINGGSLDEFKKDDAKRRNDDRRDDNQGNRRYNQRQNVVNTITESGVSVRHVKSKIFSLSHNIFVSGEQLSFTDTIEFKNTELASNAARDQPLIIEVDIGVSGVKRVLVDTGATKDIMFYSCFKALGLDERRLIPSNLSLEGFTNHHVNAMGTIELEVVMGGPNIERAEILKFVVIDIPSPYNIILGTPAQSVFGLVISVAHQRVKFMTDSGVGCVISNPRCYYDRIIEERKTSKQIITTPEKEYKLTEETRSKRHSSSSHILEPIQSDKGKNPICVITAMNIDEVESNAEESDQVVAGEEIQSIREVGDFASTVPPTHPATPKVSETDSLEVREATEIAALEETEDLIINPEFPEQTIKVGRNIAAKEREDVIQALKDNLDVFAWKVEDMEGISEEIAEHRLSIIPGFKPVRQKARVYSGEKEIAIKEEVNKLLRAGIIQEVDYATWIANVVMVLKANKKWRMCVDYTDLNKACPKDSYPLPRIDKLVDAISGHKILSFIDAYSGYHQIKMHPIDRIHTGFRAAGGIYCYRMMPFGLKNAGATYQRMINKVFGDQIGRNVAAYIDDMVIKTKESDHVVDLLETFENLRLNHMKLNPSKCAFGVTSGKFLGFMVSEKGIEANPEKIQALINMKPPKNLTEVQQLNGRITALSRFISRSAEKCLPFFKALKGGKNFRWTNACDQAFQQMKEYLGRPPLLTSPKLGDVLYTYLAASDLAIAAVLIREQDLIQRPIYYVSHALTDVETRYLDAEKIALALVIAARRLRAYFMAHSIIVYTNFPMKKFLFRPDVSGRMLRWSIELTEFDISYQPRKAIKGQALADFLVESSFSGGMESDLEPMQIDDSIKVRPKFYWTMYVDGSSSMTVKGAGILLLSPFEQEKIEKAIRFNFPASNNQAEYEALVAGLDLAISLMVQDIVIFCDSQLVVKQIGGEYSILHPILAQYAEMTRKLLSKFRYWELIQIDRSGNMRADELSKLASEELEKQKLSVIVEFLDQPSIEKIEVMVIDEQREKDWVDLMTDYIENDILPADPREALLLKKRSPRFTVVGGILYRRSFTNPLLRCVPPRQTLQVLHEVHKGACGGHQGARTLADKIISSGYYWPSLRAEAVEYTRRCDQCQRYGDVPRLPATPQTPIVATWPFDMWGLDSIGGLKKARGSCDHLLVAVDYFSKWIEAMPLKNVNEEATMRFVHDQIWCRFGLPRAIICDNGTNFVGKRFTKFLQEKGIQHWPSSVCHPEGNGQAEAANKLIVYGLKKTLKAKKARWIDELDKVLWSVRTTPRGPTKETPFALCYGSEAMVPIETNLPSARVLHYNARDNERHRRHDLDLLEERRLQAGLQMAYYKQKTKEYHDKRVNPRTFQVGDLVLRKIESTNHKRPDGKLGPNWEGPLIIAKIVREGTYRLCEEDGTVIKNPWHANHLKKYFP